MPLFSKLLVAMVTTVDVILDRQDKIYHPGDTILGTVIIQSDEEKYLRLVKGTRVRCKGLSSIDLKIETGGSLDLAFIDEDARVLSHKLTKSSSRRGSVEVIKYEYPFRYTLAKDLPSTFKSHYGRMDYFIKVFVPSGVSVSYFEGRGEFTVIGNLDLNQRPELKQPIKLDQEAKVKTLLTEGSVSFHIQLPHKGYAIGDKVRVHQEIKNNCKQPVNASISLVQKISYKFGNMVRLDKENKVKAFGKVIEPNATDICDQEIFEIPVLPVTSVTKLKDDRKTVKVEYFLKYEIVAKPLWLKKFKNYIPFVIGSVPFKEDVITQTG